MRQMLWKTEDCCLREKQGFTSERGFMWGKNTANYTGCVHYQTSSKTKIIQATKHQSILM
jgi:hypothetical protein